MLTSIRDLKIYSKTNYIAIVKCLNILLIVFSFVFLGGCASEPTINNINTDQSINILVIGSLDETQNYNISSSEFRDHVVNQIIPSISKKFKVSPYSDIDELVSRISLNTSTSLNNLKGYSTIKEKNFEIARSMGESVDADFVLLLSRDGSGGHFYADLLGTHTRNSVYSSRVSVFRGWESKLSGIIGGLFNRAEQDIVQVLFDKASSKNSVEVAVSGNSDIDNSLNISSINDTSFHSTVVRNDTSWAVIIGISEYQFSGKSGLSNLIFADDDAKAFARSLHNIGWSESHIKLLINEQATERNIKIALRSWLTKAGPDDQVILFWAGHGFADPEDPEKVYLAAYDTDIGIPATGYRMDEVRSALEEIGSKNVVLFADTCHAGKLITRGNGNRGISIIPNIKKLEVPKGWIFMVGADTDRYAIEHTSWRNGAFTHALIKGVNGEADGFQSAGAKDGVVTMGELKEFMNTVMPDETQKVLGVAKRPVITTSTGDPDIWNLTLQADQ